jgi:hypothetical protein
MSAAEGWATITNPEVMLAMLHDTIGTGRLSVVLAGFAERGRLPSLLSSDLRRQFLAHARWVFGLGTRPLPIELPVWEPTEGGESQVIDIEARVQLALSGARLEWWHLLGVMLAEAHGLRVFNLSQPPYPDSHLWQRRQADALRDALGNPFAPVVWEPSWRTETAVALATGIHIDNAFDRLPILADALEEAGCDNEAVLTHCRGPGPHARGCWVVDATRGLLAST